MSDLGPGELNVIDSMYCNCASPDIKINHTMFSSFRFCKKCRKEKV